MDNELFLRYKAIAIYRNAAERLLPLARLSVCKDEEERVELCSSVFSLVVEAGCDTTGELIEKLVLSDDNALSRAAARGERITPRLKAQAEKELLTLKQLSLIRPDELPCEKTDAFLPKFGYGGGSLSYGKIIKHYLLGGAGVFAGGSTFYFDGKITPTPLVSCRLSDLKNYAEEKAEIVKNTENFIKGLPAFHTLLYGDRGTGKSTTVRALAYEYRDFLKVIEVDKNSLDALPRLLSMLDGLKQRFIVFIDDLSFDEDDSRTGGFKAALEGSLYCGNALLYCTSNRRHLIKETDKPTRRNDDVQAELALFDRFGLVVTYINPGRDEFLDIFKQIVRSRGIKWRDEYASVAELAALKKGGRSPRAAKQIADLIESNYNGEKGE